MVTRLHGQGAVLRNPMYHANMFIRVGGFNIRRRIQVDKPKAEEGQWHQPMIRQRLQILDYLQEAPQSIRLKRPRLQLASQVFTMALVSQSVKCEEDTAMLHFGRMIL